MINKFLLLIRRIIVSALIIYSYDLLAVSLQRSIPINFCTLSFVSIFGISAMLGLICFSFIF